MQDNKKLFKNLVLYRSPFALFKEKKSLITWGVMDGFWFDQQIGLSKSLLTVYVPSHDASDTREQADSQTHTVSPCSPNWPGIYYM